MADKTTPTAPNTDGWKVTGRNVRFTTLDGVLFIAVNTKPDAFKGVPPTPKGNVVIATTSGNIAVTDTLKMGLNIYGPAPTA